MEISHGQFFTINLWVLSYFLGFKEQKILHLLILLWQLIERQKSFLICTSWRKKNKNLINQHQVAKLNFVKFHCSMLENRLKPSLVGLPSQKKPIAEILKNKWRLQFKSNFLLQKLFYAYMDRITLFLFVLHFVYKASVLPWHRFSNLFFLFSLTNTCKELLSSSQHATKSRNGLFNVLALKYTHVAQNRNIYGQWTTASWKCRNFNLLSNFLFSWAENGATKKKTKSFEKCLVFKNGHICFGREWETCQNIL